MAAIVTGFDVGDVEKSVSANGKVNEGRLDGWFEVYNSAFVNIPCVGLVTGTFDVKFFQHAIFNDGDSALLGLEHIDEHLFFHCSGIPEFLLTPESQMTVSNISRGHSGGEWAIGRSCDDRVSTGHVPHWRIEHAPDRSGRLGDRTGRAVLLGYG